MKIVIVEDEPFVAEHLREIVEELGYQVCAVEHNFERGVTAMESLLPDLVLLDIRMETKTTGFEIAKRAEKINIPYLFISAHTDDSTLQQANMLNPLAYIVKPFNINQIKASLVAANQVILNSVIDLTSGKTTTKMVLDHILYLQAQNNYVDIYTIHHQRVVVRNTLKNVIKEINKSFIKQVHRSYAVNFNNIQQKTTNEIHVNDVVIPYTIKD